MTINFCITSYLDNHCVKEISNLDEAFKLARDIDFIHTWCPEYNDILYRHVITFFEEDNEYILSNGQKIDAEIEIYDDWRE